MNFLKKYLAENMLLKVASFNAIGILVKIITGFVTQKALAIFVGPAGMGAVGNFRDFIAGMQTLSSVGLSNGIIKYVAEFKKDTQKIKEILSSALGLVLITIFISSVGLFFTANYWNERIFSGNYDFAFIFKIIALAIPFYALNSFLAALINGYSKFKIYVSVNIAGNIVGLVITLWLLWQYRLEGALYAILIVPALAFFITLFFIYGKRANIQLFRFSGFKWETVKRFKTFILMALLSGLAAPVIRILIRDLILVNEDENAVGYWEGMYRISGFYLMFFTSLMTLYILPRLSEADTTKAFKSEVINFYKTILPVVAIGFVVFYFFREYVILILQSPEFLPMQSLFVWQLIGDFFKIASMVIAYQFLAKNMFWHFVISEIASLLLLYFLSMWLISAYGFVGASMGYALQMLIYLIAVFFIFRKKLFGKTE